MKKFTFISLFLTAILSLGLFGNLIFAQTVEFTTTAYTSGTTDATTGTTSTWQVPAGVNTISIIAIGGGGGGGAVCPGGGGTKGCAGGGGGAYVRTNNYTVTPGEVLTIHVGSRGSGHQSCGGTYRGWGGDSWVKRANGTIIALAKGASDVADGAVNEFGIGGQSSQCVGNDKFSGGNGGKGSTGPWCGAGGGGAAGGGNGGNGSTFNPGSGATHNSALLYAGNGGNGTVSSELVTNNGHPGENYGGGGGGGTTDIGVFEANGGDGAPGYVFISYSVSCDATPGTIAASVWECAPGDTSVVITSTAAATSTATGGTYNWQFSTNGTTWSDLSGNAAQYTATATGYYRRGYTAGTCATVFTDAVQVTHPSALNPGTLADASGNTSMQICQGKNVFVSLTASYSGTVTWQTATSLEGPWTTVSSASPLTISGITQTTYVRYLANFTTSCALPSNNVYTITVNALPEVTSISVPTDPCPGEATYTVSANTSSSATITGYTWGGDATGNSATGTVTATLPNCGHTYNVNLKVTDNNGCESATTTGSFTTTSPTMTFGTINSLEALTNTTDCKFYVPSEDALTAAVNDALTSTCGNTVTLSNFNPAAGSEINATKTVTATATDMCGNTQTVSIEVTVPTVTFSVVPATETFTLPYGVGTMNVTLASAPTYEPNDPSYVYENDLANPLGEGSHNITWTLKNACGEVIANYVEVVKVVLPDCETAVTLDGYDYPVVRVGYDCWFKENVKATTDIADVVAYDNDETANKDKFGMLYTWHAAVAADPETGSEEGGSGSGPASMMPMPIPPVDATERTQGICPEGWAIPTVEDFQRLFVNAGNDVAYLKDMDPTTWTTGKCGTAPSTGFNARGAGYYLSSIHDFNDLLSNTRFWTDKANAGETKATCCEFNYYCSEPMFKEVSAFDKLSVRCIKINTDLPTPPPTTECPSIGTTTIEFLDGNTTGYHYDNYKLRMRVSTPILDYDAEKVDGAEYIAHYRNPGASYAKDHTIASTGSDNPYYANMWVTEDGVFVADIYYDDDNFMGLWGEIDQIQIYLEANIDCVPDGVDQSESVILKSVTNCPIYHPSSVMDKYLEGVAATVSIDNFTSGSVDMNSISWTVSANGITKTYTPANNNTQIEVGIEASTSSSNSGDQWIALSWAQLIADFGTPVYKLTFVPSMGTTCDGNPVTVTGFPTTFPIATSPEECPSVVEDPDYIVGDEFFITLYEGYYTAAIPFDFEGIGEVEVEGSYYLEPYSIAPTKYNLSDAMYTVSFDNYDNHYWIEIYIPVNAQGLPSAGLSADQILHVNVQINHPECSGVLVTGTYQAPAAPAVECPTMGEINAEPGTSNNTYIFTAQVGNYDPNEFYAFTIITTKHITTGNNHMQYPGIISYNSHQAEYSNYVSEGGVITCVADILDVTGDIYDSILVTFRIGMPGTDCEMAYSIRKVEFADCPSIGDLGMFNPLCQEGFPTVISLTYGIDNYSVNMVDVDNSGILIKDMNQNTIATLTVGTNNNNSHSIIISENNLIATFYNHHNSSNNEFGSSFYVVPFLRTNCSDGVIGDTYHNAEGDPVLVTCEYDCPILGGTQVGVNNTVFSAFTTVQGLANVNDATEYGYQIEATLSYMDNNYTQTLTVDRNTAEVEVVLDPIFGLGASVDLSNLVPAEYQSYLPLLLSNGGTVNITVTPFIEVNDTSCGTNGRITGAPKSYQYPQ